MVFRLIGKFTIAVGCDTYKDTISTMKKTFGELKELGIKCAIYLKKRLIVTKDIIIKFIFKKSYSHYSRHIYGVKCHGCYGFSDMETYNITNGKNKCKGKELLDYVLEKESDDV